MTKLTKYEEAQLWAELERDNFLPTEVDVLPECAQYQGTDHHGRDMWKGVSGRMYVIR